MFMLLFFWIQTVTNPVYPYQEQLLPIEPFLDEICHLNHRNFFISIVIELSKLLFKFFMGHFLVDIV